jgi:signal transduction histidine kinase
LRTIFGPIVQVSAGESRGASAAVYWLGLGLFIVREIVSRHQGTVTVESTQPGRTVFSVQLPRDVKASEAQGG